MSRRSSRRSSQPGSLHACSPAPPTATPADATALYAARFRRHRTDQDPIDAAAIHVDDLKAVATRSDSVGDHRDSIEPCHQIPAQRVKIGIVAGEPVNTEHLFQLVK